MAVKDAVIRAYEILQNHRAVAIKLGLPIHEVLYLLGYMSEELYIRTSEYT